jgi:hypothetical protein
MSDVLSNDDLDALAAEYVLGTLDTEERRGATALLEVDHAFRGTVRIWERRLSELHLMVEPVEPDAKILERIKAKIGEVPQIPISEEAPLPQPANTEVMGEAKAAEAEAGEPKAGEPKPDESKPEESKPDEAKAPGAEGAAIAVVEIAWPEGEPKPTLVPDEAAAKPEEPPARPPEPPPRPATRRGVAAAEAVAPVLAGRGWKISTVLTTLIALALAALIGAWRYFPERLPPQLRATTVLHIPEPPPPPLPPPRREPPPPFDE